MELTHYQLHNPQKSIEVAAILQKFVQEKKLTANIQGKQYPLVEAWQFAGSQLGLYPICTELKDISTPDEIKYFAKVEVRRFEDDKLVSNGFAICSNKEYSKRKFDEYAIASMAQTRATGKSFRNLLAWLMKAAGFEATPAEEMDFATNVVTQDVTHEVPTKEELDLLRKLTYSARFDTEAQQLLRIPTHPTQVRRFAAFY